MLLLLLLKGKTAKDLIKPLYLHFLSFYVFVWVFLCVYEHMLGHKCVMCVCVCGGGEVCVNIANNMREIENMPETQIFHKSGFTLKLFVNLYTYIYILDEDE